MKFDKLVCALRSVDDEKSKNDKYLGIQTDENISPIPVQASNPHPQIWFRLFELCAIRAHSISRRDETSLWLPVYLWFPSVGACRRALVWCWRDWCRCSPQIWYRSIGVRRRRPRGCIVASEWITSRTQRVVHCRAMEKRTLPGTRSACLQYKCKAIT